MTSNREIEVLKANNSEMMCTDHPDQPAVLVCENMGFAYCAECRDNNEMRTGCSYCPNVGKCEIQAYYNEQESS